MLLILREEIICFIILMFLIFYYIINKEKDKNNNFLSVIIVGEMHVFLDMITVFTVNNRDFVPDTINRILHIAYYFSGMLFSKTFYNYILNLSTLYKKKWLRRFGGNIPLIIFSILLIVLPMEYENGRGTDYSYGLLVIVGYMIFLAQCLTCCCLVIIYKDLFEKRVKRAIIPMIIAMIFTIILQAFVPELLMTGGAITFICIGLFVALDNPDIDYKKQALWDYLTGLKNQNCYKKDMERYIDYAKNHKSKARLTFVKEQRIGFVVADLNFLKQTNDTYGHDEGDRLISAAAKALKKNLKTSQAVYRMGGDEFVAIYISPKDDVVLKEIENVVLSCAENKDFAVPLSIAIGYSSGMLDGDIDAVFKSADKLMYENKLALKESGMVSAPAGRN